MMARGDESNSQAGPADAPTPTPQPTSRGKAVVHVAKKGGRKSAVAKKPAPNTSALESAPQKPARRRSSSSKAKEMFEQSSRTHYNR